VILDYVMFERTVVDGIEFSHGPLDWVACQRAIVDRVYVP
jgi:hypothetical protein